MNQGTFLIGPIRDGIRRDSKSWSQPNDSFETLTNAYQWRDRVVKRSGYTLLGTLANGTPVMGLRTLEGFNINQKALIAFDLTTAYRFNGTVFIVLPSVMPVTWSGSDSDFFFTTNYAAAFWATNFIPGFHGFRLTLPLVGTTFKNASGIGPTAQVDVAAAGNTFQVGDFVYFLNVTGVAAANNLAYGRVTAINVGGDPDVFTVLSLNPDPAFVFVNGNVNTGSVLSSSRSITGQDGIRYYGGLSNGTGWANYNPPINPFIALVGALLIFPYRGYLVFLNTWEGNEDGIFNFSNRARWTEFGTPYYSEPVPIVPSNQGIEPNAVRDDLFGFGGFLDASTNEDIVGAEFVRDILIVYFENSTWRLRFVNNEQNPFVWERVNKDFGSQSTFSVVGFDKGIMAIGNRGVIISDGNDTIRFDEKIPDDIFNIRQANFGFKRVHGIRTFRTKLVYWTYPSSQNPSGIYPDKVLVFNYETKIWAFFDDVFTTFGYYYPDGRNLTWGDLTDDWSSTYESWDSGTSQSGYENIVSGNQQGFVFVLEKTNGENSPSLNILSITANVFTSTNHNLPDLSWIELSDITTTTSIDGVSLNGRRFQVNNPDPMTNPSTFQLSEFQPIAAGNAVGATYTYTVGYAAILEGSVQINIGALIFKDLSSNGTLEELNNLGFGTINYATGKIDLTFTPAIVSTPVNIRVVSKDPLQDLIPLETLNDSVDEGLITHISGLDIQTKIFNFFQNDQKARLSKIDFYVVATEVGQFTCNVLADSGNDAVNTPLSDNFFSNVVMTTTNPYQVGQGNETIYRLFCDAVCSTIQLQLTYSIEQMAVSAITNSDIELNAMMISMRKAGRVI